MPAKRELIDANLQSDISQKWINNSSTNTEYDQFGFVIHRGMRYRLEYRGVTIATLHSVSAAKLISTIILNDIVSNKKFE